MNPNHLIAAAVAVKLIEDGTVTGNLDATSDEQREHVAHASLAVLANFGLTLEEAPTHGAVIDQLQRRGGWSRGATPAPLLYMASCLQCGEPELWKFQLNAKRRTAIREHTDATGHTVISRWEQPSTFMS